MRSWLSRISARLRGRRLDELARASGDPFRSSPYFEAAEPDITWQWRELIRPFIHDSDFTTTVDLAAGHGRNSEKLRALATHLVIVDINEECLDSCRRRFGADPTISYLRTDGHSLLGIDDDSATLVYCFDAMVHFAPEVVEAYLRETARVLVPGGRGFFHHSNRLLPPRSDFTEAPHWRNHMSLGLFAELANAAGLDVVRSRALDWGRGEARCAGLDGFTLVGAPRR